MGRRVNTSVHSSVIPLMRGSAAASISLTFPHKWPASSTQSGSDMFFDILRGGRLMQRESFCQWTPSLDGRPSCLNFGSSSIRSTPLCCKVSHSRNTDCLGVIGAQTTRLCRSAMCARLTLRSPLQEQSLILVRLLPLRPHRPAPIDLALLPLRPLRDHPPRSVQR